MTYYQVLISAEDEEQAATIRDALLAKKLILGGPTVCGPAKFWWKGEIVGMDYCYLVTYTTDRHKDAVTAEAERVAEEEFPMLSFIPFEGNQKLLDLIDKTLA